MKLINNINYPLEYRRVIVHRQTTACFQPDLPESFANRTSNTCVSLDLYIWSDSYAAPS